MASLIHRGLTREGLAADVAANGEDALWMSGAHDYDVIVLDVMLPGIDGFETCRRLRTSGVRAPVVVCTSRTDRKSTRLNSSHQIISYAVFCLKKKNKMSDNFCRDERHREGG